MIKLKDVLSTATVIVGIMDGVQSAITINPNSDIWKQLTEDFLDRNIERINAHNNMIRVWLKEDKEESHND